MADESAGNFTRDAILGGRLTIVQPREGYRFSIDPVLLCGFTAIVPGQVVVDLGAGCGVMSLILAVRLGRGRVTAVEIQPRLAECARENVRVNAGRLPPSTEIIVMETDWKRLTRAETGPADLVVSNPPYRPLGTGRVCPDGEEAAARHEIKGGLSSAVRTAAGLLSTGGRLALIYPADRLPVLFSELKDNGFEAKRLRMVHPRPDRPARLALVEARLGGGAELSVEPPLFVHDKDGNYSAETADLLSGRTMGFRTGSFPISLPGR